MSTRQCQVFNRHPPGTQGRPYQALPGLSRWCCLGKLSEAVWTCVAPKLPVGLTVSVSSWTFPQNWKAEDLLSDVHTGECVRWLCVCVSVCWTVRCLCFKGRNLLFGSLVDFVFVVPPFSSWMLSEWVWGRRFICVCISDSGWLSVVVSQVWCCPLVSSH